MKKNVFGIKLLLIEMKQVITVRKMRRMYFFSYKKRQMAHRFKESNFALLALLAERLG